jgi:diguanylate cyclase (GGDEF)-like protein/PAS domain S-box-containing protein
MENGVVLGQFVKYRRCLRLFIACVTVLFVFVFVILQFQWHRIHTLYTPLLNNTAITQAQVADIHIQFEELLANESDLTIDSVWQDFGELTDTLNTVEVIVQRLDQQKKIRLAVDFLQIRDRVSSFRVDTQMRWNKHENEGGYEHSLQQEAPFHASYEQLQKSLKSFYIDVEKVFLAAQKKHQSYFSYLFLMWLSLFIMLFFLLERVFLQLMKTQKQQIVIQEKQALIATAMATVNESVVITDANNCILSVNPAFSVITGFSAAEAIGRRPNMLSSGKQDAAFYKTMWEALNEHGCWQGEVVNKRKEGSLYTEWLSIVIVKDKAGRVKNHVAVFSDITKRKQAEQLVLHQANYDPLTDLANRRMFLDQLDQAMSDTQRSNKSMALLYLDLDQFKPINDRFGHVQGDHVLKSVATRLKESVRKADLVARLGGDEFVVLLTHLACKQDALPVAQKIHQAIVAPIDIGSGQVSVGCSIGLAYYPDDAHFMDQLISLADTSMYRVKARGGGVASD